MLLENASVYPSLFTIKLFIQGREGHAGDPGEDGAPGATVSIQMALCVFNHFNSQCLYV